jgi:hypothetical protein
MAGAKGRDCDARSGAGRPPKGKAVRAYRTLGFSPGGMDWTDRSDGRRFALHLRPCLSNTRNLVRAARPVPGRQQLMLPRPDGSPRDLGPVLRATKTTSH